MNSHWSCFLSFLLKYAQITQPNNSVRVCVFEEKKESSQERSASLWVLLQPRIMLSLWPSLKLCEFNMEYCAKIYASMHVPHWHFSACSWLVLQLAWVYEYMRFSWPRMYYTGRRSERIHWGIWVFTVDRKSCLHKWIYQRRSWIRWGCTLTVVFMMKELWLNKTKKKGWYCVRQLWVSIGA